MVLCSRKVLVADVMPMHQPFRSIIGWDDRTWQPWEKFLWSAMSGSKLVQIALLVFGVPFMLVAIPLLPLINVLLLRSPPAPRGAFAVGVADTQRTLVGKISVPGVGTDILRFRTFYPSLKTKAPWFQRRNAAWLPAGKAASRYASAHPDALPFPKRMRSCLAPYLGAFMHLARLPREVSHSADAAPAPSRGWPLVVFSHGMYGCAMSYSSLCAEMASHGAVVVALEHKDGSAVYSETDDGDRSGHISGDTRTQLSRRAAEVRAAVASARRPTGRSQGDARGGGGARSEVRIRVSIVSKSLTHP